jgi:hypothetical protein
LLQPFSEQLMKSSRQSIQPFRHKSNKSNKIQLQGAMAIYFSKSEALMGASFGAPA